MMLRAALLALLPACAASAALVDFGPSVPGHPPLAPIGRAEWEPRTGDLVFRASGDLVGERIRAASGTDAIYSHVGVVVTRGGQAQVVDVSPFGSGVVAFTDLAAFTGDPATTDLLVLRPARVEAGRLAREAERLAAAGIRFDYDFDMADAGELYCAELAYNLLAGAGVDLRSVRWTRMSVPLAGERLLVTPDALARTAGMQRVARRSRPS